MFCLLYILTRKRVQRGPLQQVREEAREVVAKGLDVTAKTDPSGSAPHIGHSVKHITKAGHPPPNVARQGGCDASGGVSYP